MLYKEFLGLLFLLFVGWVLVAGDGSARISRVCAPIGWVGNGATSLTALVVPSYQGNVQRGFGRVEYGCRYLVWRLFYQDEYNAWLAQQPEAARSAAQPNAPAPGAAPSPAPPPTKPAGSTEPPPVIVPKGQ